MLLALAMILVVILGFSGLASAVSLSFQATDPNDTTNADFDIIAFGASPNGDKIDFWIQVRGQINTEPDNGYMNAYAIDIYSSNEDYEMAAFWINYEGNTQEIVWFSVGNNPNYLSPGDYVVSGNKLTFHIDSALLADLGDEYQVIVTTVHTESGSPSLSGLHTDQAEYDYNPQSGGTSGGGGENPPPDEEIGTFAMLWGASMVICSVIWLIIWIIIAIWAYKDAQKKCMDSPIIWFIVVFLLGLIGLIIYLVLRKDKCKEKQAIVQAPPPPS